MTSHGSGDEPPWSQGLYSAERRQTCELRDTEENPVSKEDARRLILDKYQVPEQVRRERRRRNPKASNAVVASRKDREMAIYRTNETARDPPTRHNPLS